MRVLSVLLILLGVLLVIHSARIENEGIVHVAGRYRRQGLDVIERSRHPDEFRKEMGPRWLAAGVLLIAGFGLYSIVRTT